VLRILHVIPSLTEEQGGTSACVAGLARFQAQGGHRVTILSTDQGARRGEKPIELNGTVEVLRLPVRGPDRRAFSPQFRGEVRRQLGEHDVVHVHSVFNYPVHAALQEARASGMPTVLSTHGMLHRYSLRRSRWKKRLYLFGWGPMIRSAKKAWHYTSQDEASQSWPWDESPRFVLPPVGIEPSEFLIDRNEARASVSRAWPEIGDAPYVVFLGRLHPKKRPDLLVEAFLAGAPRDFKLVVAGPDEAGLWPSIADRFLHDSSAKQRVVRLGMITGQHKLQLLAAATLFALPSEHENFGITPLESLAVGTPVLLSPHVDLGHEAVDAGVGFAAPAEAAAWRTRLSELLSRPADLESLRDQARRWAVESFGWGGIAQAFVERYRWVLAGCPRA
jgi:glycosyltransferase involved in cell wall biosynthesis